MSYGQGRMVCKHYKQDRIPGATEHYMGTTGTVGKMDRELESTMGKKGYWEEDSGQGSEQHTDASHAFEPSYTCLRLGKPHQAQDCVLPTSQPGLHHHLCHTCPVGTNVIFTLCTGGSPYIPAIKLESKDPPVLLHHRGHVWFMKDSHIGIPPVRTWWTPGMPISS